MRIYSMTATFGKLENETLVLEEGLNILHRPNEWGKSTWCAFLAAMLYGLDKGRSKQTALSEKEHYTPWSGSPMSGSMDICWQGRNITIQRRTKGRSIFGEFKAFETDTGLPVPELNADNCGQMLLGVERAVFTRSGFIRLQDLPVTQDDALRRRLNALVTTGDESNTGDLLEQKLKDLKNRCRYNRTGLLPQAEGEAADIQNKLRELEVLEQQSRRCRERTAQLEQELQRLTNHLQALEYDAAQEKIRQVHLARRAAVQAAGALARQEEICAQLPPKDRLLQQSTALRQLHGALADVQRAAPTAPVHPEYRGIFQGMTLENAQAKVHGDIGRYGALGSLLLWLLIPALLTLLGGVAAALLTEFTLAGWIAAGLGGGAALLWLVLFLRNRKKADAIAKFYGSAEPRLWARELQDYVNHLTAEQAAQAAYAAQHQLWTQQLRQLQLRLDDICGGESPSAVLNRWQQQVGQWNELEARCQIQRLLADKAAAMEAMVPELPAPAAPDDYTWTEQQTRQRLEDAGRELNQLRQTAGACQGRMEAIGQRTVLERQLEKKRQRIQALQHHYNALTLALEQLRQARTQLQRRFAPRITRRAQEMMHRLTQGRYDRLVLEQDLSVQTGTQEETTLRSPLWRSDGTADQLYLALRLAVSEALTGDAPLILDDALVRFDDDRLKAALGVLQEMAQDRQILLFTCQGREAQLLNR